MKTLIISMALLFGILGIMHYGLNKRTRARLILHAGPYFYLDINEAGQVIDAAPNNEAGEALLKKLELRRLSLDTALDILGLALKESDAWNKDKPPLVAVSRLRGEEARQIQTLVETKMMSLREDFAESRIVSERTIQDNRKTKEKQLAE
ncbi:MAG: hypothetical protein J6H18_03980 [Lachnospiraceae bacterium]|nr:hypothetical protein [Lachnospiraceae bacterium]